MSRLLARLLAYLFAPSRAGWATVSQADLDRYIDREDRD
jgi:hypothetical protein